MQLQHCPLTTLCRKARIASSQNQASIRTNFTVRMHKAGQDNEKSGVPT
jgi:hypothetical protein